MADIKIFHQYKSWIIPEKPHIYKEMVDQGHSKMTKTGQGRGEGRQSRKAVDQEQQEGEK